MKKLVYIALFAFSAVAAQTDDAFPDLSSITITNCGEPYMSSETHFFNRLYQSYLQSPIFLTGHLLSNFTSSSLFYHRTAGEVRLAQTAQEQQQLGLKSYGLYRYRDYLFFGDLQLARTYENQKQWNRVTAQFTKCQPNVIMPCSFSFTSHSC